MKDGAILTLTFIQFSRNIPQGKTARLELFYHFDDFLPFFVPLELKVFIAPSERYLSGLIRWNRSNRAFPRPLIT